MTVEKKCFLKWPLIITAVIVVSRVVVELAGAPYTMASVFNVAQLHIIAPFYFGLAIATSVGTGLKKPGICSLTARQGSIATTLKLLFSRPMRVMKVMSSSARQSLVLLRVSRMKMPLFLSTSEPTGRGN